MVFARAVTPCRHPAAAIRQNMPALIRMSAVHAMPITALLDLSLLTAKVVMDSHHNKMLPLVHLVTPRHLITIMQHPEFLRMRPLPVILHTPQAHHIPSVATSVTPATSMQVATSSRYLFRKQAS